MSILDRFRSPESLARRAQERAAREAEAARVAAADAAERQRLAEEAERQRQIQLAEEQRQLWVEAAGPELADAPMDDPADAKLALRLARVRKQELASEKRELATELAEVREAWRERTAGRISTIGLGRGGGAKMLRVGIQAKRRTERLEHAAEVNAFSDARQVIDRKLAIIDRLIVELQRKK